MQFLKFFSCLLLCHASWAYAQEQQSLAVIQQSVEAFVREKTAEMPGQYTVTSTRIDPRLKLRKCDQLQPYLPSGSRLWGNSSVGVRCAGPETWSLYVPVQVKVANQVLVAVRPITSGQQVQPGDVELQMRDITKFAGSALTSLDQISGRHVVAPVPNGTILRAEMFRAANIIRQGQTVQISAKGNGFTVTSDGQAMGNAALGQVVTVKTRSGQLIKGIVKGEGAVEVVF